MISYIESHTKNIWNFYDICRIKYILYQITTLKKFNNIEIIANRLREIEKSLNTLGKTISINQATYNHNREIENIKREIEELTLTVRKIPRKRSEGLNLINLIQHKIFFEYSISHIEKANIRKNFNKIIECIKDDNIQTHYRYSMIFHFFDKCFSRESDNILFVASYYDLSTIISSNQIEQKSCSLLDYLINSLPKNLFIKYIRTQQQYTKKNILHHIIEIDNLNSLKTIYNYFPQFIGHEDSILLNDDTCVNRQIIHYAAKAGSKNILMYLLEKGYYESELTTYPTLLDIAVESGNSDIVHILLISQKNINLHSDSIYLAASNALSMNKSTGFFTNEYSNILEIIKYKKPPIVYRDGGKNSSLISCLLRSDIAHNSIILKDIINHSNIKVIGNILKTFRTEVKSRDYYDNNLLHYAVLYGNLEIAKILSEYNPDLISQRNSRGRTPLHNFAYKISSENYLNHKDSSIMINILCNNKLSSLSIRDNTNKTALQILAANKKITKDFCFIVKNIPSHKKVEIYNKIYMLLSQDMNNTIFSIKNILPTLFMVLIMVISIRNINHKNNTSYFNSFFIPILVLITVSTFVQTVISHHNQKNQYANQYESLLDQLHDINSPYISQNTNPNTYMKEATIGSYIEKPSKSNLSY